MPHGIIWTFIIIVLVYLFCYLLPPAVNDLPTIPHQDSPGASQATGPVPTRTFLPEHLIRPTKPSSQAKESSLLSEEFFPEERPASGPLHPVPSDNLSNKPLGSSVESLLSPEEPLVSPNDPPIKKGTFYDQIKGLSIDQGLAFLEQKALRAQQIIPTFPSFPQVWLDPPKNKGSYGSLGERHCVEFLELLFPARQFKKIRPKWLRNPRTKRPLELDGYCSDLMLAVEYNGIQHYVWPNFVHKTRKEFDDQQFRDQVKADICIDRHICLIRIPYIVPHKHIPLAIYGQMLDGVPGLNPFLD